MLEGDLEKLAKDHPNCLEYLEKILALEPHGEWTTGWPKPSWLPPNIIRVLTGRGILKMTMKRTRYPFQDEKVYQLVDRNMLDRWLTKRSEDEEASNQIVDWDKKLEFDRDELFADYVVSSDSERLEILDEICEAIEYPGERLHTLMVGPPASGKTIIMDAIQSLDESNFCSGGATSAVGFAEILIILPKRIHIIDELDKWWRDKKKGADAEGILLPFMEEGQINIHKHKNHQVVINKGVVLCGANRMDWFSPELISRFKGRVYMFPEYTKGEFLEILNRKFTSDPWNFPLELAETVGEAVWRYDKNIRTAMGLGSVAKIAIEKGKDPQRRVILAVERMKRFNPDNQEWLK